MEAAWDPYEDPAEKVDWNSSVRSRLDRMKFESVDLPDDAWERRDEQDVRELIVLAAWPMLAHVVGRLRQRLPPHVRVEEEDLRSFGVIGLYKAIDRYDPSLGHTFDKFASTFIYGAVLDELRSQDWAPRSLRKRQKDLEKATADLRKELGRDPLDEELAEELRWTIHDITHTRKQIDAAWPRSLDEIRGEAQRDMYAVVADAHGSPEQHTIGVHDSHENDRSTLLTDRMATYIHEMPPQKKAVVILCYYLGMRQSDVAKVLGIPDSRVSHLHLSVMDEIHTRLEELLSAGED